MLKTLIAVCCACVSLEVASMRTAAADGLPEGLAGVWLAEDINGGGVIDYLQTTLEIREDGTYSGMAGCNNFTGVFHLSGTRITFSPTAATRKMCVPAVMNQEQKFLDALKTELSWKIEGPKLLLGLPDGAAVLALFTMNSGSDGSAE